MPDSLVKLYGTVEPPQAFKSVQVGALSLLYSSEALRRISWQGVELVRAVTWPIRDEDWGTYPIEGIEESFEAEGGSSSGKLRFSVGNNTLACELEFSASEQGEVRVQITMTPTAGPFRTNRAGLTVLHPIKGIAGASIGATRSNGECYDTEFPLLISPSQPVMDIAGMTYEVDGKGVDITFTDEIFEMEDQRNWSDASYKTYCVPLVHPFVYPIDQPVSQAITMKFSGEAASSDDSGSSVALTMSPTDAKAPGIGLVIEDGWAGNEQTRDFVAKCQVERILLRADPETGPDDFAQAAKLVQMLGAELDAEIVLRDTDPVGPGLTLARDAFAQAGLAPARVLALREGYLLSHQPSGPWPDGPTPVDMCHAAREAFPDAAIGGGMMTNFTELNRCRPDMSACDYLSHGNTAIVHAGDDMSVLETLETLPQIFESADALRAGKPYRLGLISIGMRSNPYGSAVADNPTQVRRTMAKEDPRQRGLFAAAWAVGVLSATQGSAAETLCLAAPAGPFGIVYEKQDYPQAGYDEGQGAVYPLFHVFREAARMAGSARVSFDNLPNGLVAYGVAQGDTTRVMIANTTSQSISLDLGTRASITMLDENSFDEAVSNPEWLEDAEKNDSTRIDIWPFAVVFATVLS